MVNSCPQWMTFLDPPLPVGPINTRFVHLMKPPEPCHNSTHSLQNDFEILKRVITYNEMACSTALTMICFPAADKSFSFHPVTFCHIRSTINLKRSVLFCQKPRSLRYLEWCGTCGTPNNSKMWVRTSWHMFLLNTISRLWEINPLSQQILVLWQNVFQLIGILFSLFSEKNIAVSKKKTGEKYMELL